MYPWVLLAFGIRKRLDSARWLVAITALLTESLFSLRIAVEQGSRFTHWTIGDTIAQPLFFLNGNAFAPQTVTDSLLLIAIVYAVYRYMQGTLRRQGALEQELKSARELQQVLIPEALPEVAGFAVTSAYRPAQEVGGDFFQIIPLDGSYTGSTLILLGDVSGKGLRAAMTVSLIVGAVRTVARFLPHPAEVLAELNSRLCGRLQGGFATCLVLRLDPDGHCAVASAGHPAPLVNKREIALPGSLPLGVVPGETYQESALVLREGDHLALYTDGLLEARNAKGEIFSFERLDALFSTFPSADQASDAAVNFGQDDDITVLTLTRLAMGEKSMTQLTAPALTQA
jgi:serine phosphatase RsbU (regulator of sigma subunit)